jgi:hypothetical protein
MHTPFQNSEQRGQPPVVGVHVVRVVDFHSFRRAVKVHSRTLGGIVVLNRKLSLGLDSVMNPLFFTGAAGESCDLPGDRHIGLLFPEPPFLKFNFDIVSILIRYVVLRYISIFPSLLPPHTPGKYILYVGTSALSPA